MTHYPYTLPLDNLTNGLAQAEGPDLIEGARWYEAQEAGEGLVFRFPVGVLSGATYLTAEMLLDGTTLTSFTLYLQEGEDGPRFGLNFGLLNQCSARMRVPLEAVNQNRWRYPREGAWLKPRCRDDRVDLRRVDRATLEIERKGPAITRFCVTPLVATTEAPPLLDGLVLPKGALLDELGQSTLHDWPGKTTCVAELEARLEAQLASAAEQTLPEAYSRWGGWLDRQVEATGYFRTHKDGERCWLVDPDGYLFWSTGLDCVRFGIDTAVDGLEDAVAWLPEADGAYAAAHIHGEQRAFDYLKSNFIRVFGPEAAAGSWATLVLSQLRGLGFNTVANWSDWHIAKGRVPYTRPMDARAITALPAVYRDFPDVYHPDFAQAAMAYAEQLSETVDDPAFIGYFLMNEPTWGFAQETPAAGMLYNTETCHSREALAAYLAERYGSDQALSAAWDLPSTLDGIRSGVWQHVLTDAAQADLADFSERMVTRYFTTLSKACHEIDPNHLNLGVRYYTIPPAWAVEGMRTFDVFSMNCYRPRVLADEMEQVYQLLEMPIMVGEWHFGALDAGLPAAGIGHVSDQLARGQAYRIYVEDAAVKPWCVGVHYFTIYDQSAIGRFDGENYNIGFVDTCSRPYPALAAAARLSHERLYQVATGELPPYDDAPEYLPLLFM